MNVLQVIVGTLATAGEGPGTVIEIVQSVEVFVKLLVAPTRSGKTKGRSSSADISSSFILAVLGVHYLIQKMTRCDQLVHLGSQRVAAKKNPIWSNRAHLLKIGLDTSFGQANITTAICGKNPACPQSLREMPP